MTIFRRCSRPFKIAPDNGVDVAIERFDAGNELIGQFTRSKLPATQGSEQIGYAAIGPFGGGQG
jgi:hypothetical protein